MDYRDRCPNCSFNLGKYCFDNDKGAGDDVTCPECGASYWLNEFDNGTETFYIFETKEESDGR